MKKLLTLAAVCMLTVFGSEAFAELTVAPRIGASSAVIESAYPKYTGTTKALNFGADALFITDSDLVFKGSLGTKFPWSESDDSEFLSKTDYAGVDFSFGIGKALVRNEKLTLAVTGIVGAIVCQTSESEEKTDLGTSVIETTSHSYVGGGKIGADLTAIIHVTQKVGVFANAGLYFTIGGFGNIAETKYHDGSGKTEENSDVTMFDGCIFNPSLGVSITF